MKVVIGEHARPGIETDEPTRGAQVRTTRMRDRVNVEVAQFVELDHGYSALFGLHLVLSF
ncbi:hypothetical protein BC360_07725 [Ensifer sp. LC163]|nr:hypothetical protein BC360_07725 [Ensifer sp. LC163]